MGTPFMAEFMTGHPSATRKVGQDVIELVKELKVPIVRYPEEIFIRI